MIFQQSKKMKISILPGQEKQLSSKEKIEAAFTMKDVLAFDIYLEDLLIGFVMVRKFAQDAYFLWNYAIDYHYQNQNYGTSALVAFIHFMKKEYGMKKMTTTYRWGNTHAKYVYEKVGFIETNIVDEDGNHEVNMVYEC